MGKFGRVQSDFHFFGAINAGREGLQLWQGLSEYGLLVVFHALPRHVAVFNHTKPGINFKGIVQWYSLSYDNSYHYHVYSVLLLIYLCLCRCRHYYSCNKCLNSYQTSLCRQKCSSSLASCEGAGAWSSLPGECDSGCGDRDGGNLYRSGGGGGRLGW